MPVGNPRMSIITLNVNGLNSPIKRHRGGTWIKRQDPTIRRLQEMQSSLTDSRWVAITMGTGNSGTNWGKRQTRSGGGSPRAWELALLHAAGCTQARGHMPSVHPRLCPWEKGRSVTPLWGSKTTWHFAKESDFRYVEWKMPAFQQADVCSLQTWLELEVCTKVSSRHICIKSEKGRRLGREF